MYSLLLETLLAVIFGRIDKQKYTYDKIIVVMDKLLPKKEQGYVKQLLNHALNKLADHSIFIFSKPNQTLMHRLLTMEHG